VSFIFCLLSLILKQVSFFMATSFNDMNREPSPKHAFI
jgi:hypothetical protein